MNTTTVIWATVGLFTIGFLPIATAQTLASKLSASDRADDDFFGWTVSVSDEYAIIGAYSDDNNEADAGAAYIFHYDGSNWVEQTKLIASDGAQQDYFGNSVSLSGDHVLVSAYLDDDNGNGAGAAYIFSRDGQNWTEQAKLIASDGAGQDQFGRSVSLSGNYALIGAYQHDGLGPDDGAAYIFHFDGSVWEEHTKLTPGDGAAFDNFGRSVSIAGDYALIGASVDANNGTGPGSASIFHFDGAGWVEEAKFTAGDGAPLDHFGQAVSLSGDFALVGAVGDDDNGETAGSAYIFHREGVNWVEQAKLTASDGAANDNFGRTVSIFGDYAVVGAGGDDDNGSYSGSAYVFHYDGSEWIEQTKLTPSDGASIDHFGGSVSLSDSYLLVGAYGDDSWAGSAYVYFSPELLCGSISFFNARCNMNSAAQAMVMMTGDWTGETVTFDLDGNDIVSTVLSNGTNSIARMTVPHAGIGPHTVTLETPAGCYSPVEINCTVDAPPDPEWNALLAEFEVLETEALKTLPLETRNIGLAGNYPNPFNPSTTIRYSLGVDSPVSVRVFTLLGQEVVTLVDGFQKAGEQSVDWHGLNSFGQSVSSGLYFYRVRAGNTVVTGKMLFTR